MSVSLTCPNCGAPLEGASCTECRYTDRRPRRQHSLRSLQGVHHRVHISTLIDRTGSGAQFARGVPLSCRLIFSHLEQAVREVNISVQTHGDEDYGEMPRQLVAEQSVQTALRAIDTIDYRGGGDGPETHLSAIEDALARVQRAGCNRQAVREAMLVLVNDESKPARSQRAVSQLGADLRQAGVLFYLISQPTPRLLELNAAAGGMFCEISNEPEPEQMQTIAQQIAGSVVRSLRLGSAVPLLAVKEKAAPAESHPRPALRLPYLGSLRPGKSDSRGRAAGNGRS